jgi:glycosyltransferase involved in cell wall biosynthesis
MKIGIIADNPNINSSYGEIAKWLGYYLSMKHDVFYIGLQHRGSPVVMNIGDRSFAIHSGFVYYNGNGYMIDRAISVEKPDVLITIRDAITFIPEFFAQSFSLAKYKGKIRLISYVPMMEPRLGPKVQQALMDNSDFIATYSDYMRQKLINDGFPYNIVDYINIGYEHSVYHRYYDNPMLSAGNARIFGFVGLLADRRKSLGSLMTAFSHYIKSDPNAYLYIHNNLNNPYNIMDNAASLGIRGHLLMPQHNNQLDWHPEYYYSDIDMARLYSSFSATVSISTQEGFNMPFLESLACGTPVLGTRMPFYDWSDQILQCPSHEFEMQTGSGYAADPVEFAEMMHQVVERKVDVSKIEHLRWENIIGKWYGLLNGGSR